MGGHSEEALMNFSKKGYDIVTFPSKGHINFRGPMLVMSSLFVVWGVRRYFPKLKAALSFS